MGKKRETQTPAQPQKTEGLLCAIYARISPLHESGVGANYSIKSQIHEIKAKIKALGWTTREDLIFIDNNFSGKDLDRPDLEKLRYLVRGKLVGAYMAYSPDRLCRKTAHAILLREECQKAGVVQEFVSGKYEDTPEGKLAFTVQAVISEYEREKILERTTRCRREKAREGFIVGTTPPYGFTRLGKAQGNRGTLVENEAEAQVVRLIFSLYTLHGYTLNHIRRHLNEEACIRSRKGGLWTKQTIKQTLENPAYHGSPRSNYSQKLECPALVARPQFEKAQVKLAQNKVHWVGRPSTQYLLRGRLFCHKCGHRGKVGYGRTGKRYYTCGHISPHTMKRQCDAKMLALVGTDAKVWEAVWGVLSNPVVLHKLITSHLRSSSPGGARNENETSRRLEKLRRRECHLSRMLADEDCPTPYEEVKKMMKEVQAQILPLEDALGRQSLKVPPVATLASVAAEIAQEEPEDTADRMEVLAALDARVVFSQEEDTLEVSLSLPIQQNGLKSGQKNGNGSVSGNDHSFTRFPFSLTLKAS